MYLENGSLSWEILKYYRPKWYSQLGDLNVLHAQMVVSVWRLRSITCTGSLSWETCAHSCFTGSLRWETK